MIYGFFSSAIAGRSMFGIGQRLRTWLLALTAIVACAIAAGYHVMAMTGSAPEGMVTEVVYHALVLFAYAVIYLLLSDRLRRRASTSLRAFLLPILVGIALITVHYGLTSISRPPDLPTIASSPVTFGFEYGTGRPLVPATVFNMNVISFVAAAFAFVLLLRFRDLVLVKRTRASQRNWYLMLGFMAFASMLTFLTPPDASLNIWQRLAMVPAIGFMVVNSLRLSWIVFLSMSEKLMSICMSLLLLVILGGVGIMETGGGAAAFDVPLPYVFIKHYSYPLSVFVSLTVVFGILYCTTALLSLIFHLPTTSDYQQRVGELAAMHSLTNLVGQVFDSDRLFSMIVASPVETGAGSAAWLSIPDRSSPTLAPRVVAGHSIDIENVHRLVDIPALYEEIAETREPVLMEQAVADHRVTARPGEGIGSLLVVPLLSRDELLGALFVTKEVSHGFERDDTEAISVFAAQAALAIDNSRLFEERIERERLSRELAIAREVQRKLLPQSLPVLHGVSIAASSVPALEVGGDYFDFSELDDGRLAFIIADVSGKGTSAAFYMAEMQGIFRSLSRLASSPSAFLTTANAAVGPILERSVFISVIYGIVDPAGETISIARAGHCPAATASVDGQPRLLRSGGLGLGLDGGEIFRESLREDVISLKPGDVFVLYTDGVIESRNADGKEYGYDRLLDVLRNNRHEEAHDLHRVMTDDLNTFVGGSEYDDDMTLVIIKWHGIEVRSFSAAPTSDAARIQEA